MADRYLKIQGSTPGAGLDPSLKLLELAGGGHGIVVLVRASGEFPLPVSIGDAVTVSITEPLSIDDNEGSLTVDGTVAATDSGPANAGSAGISGARFTSADQSGSAADVTDAPSAGEKLVITDIVVSVDTDMRVDFKEETSGTVLYSL